ncbi:MAG: 30S ribosomal protein S17 [Gammaproteobacteria bacterium]|nr:30S ribosomal protein S17 [Gammaproteobacteria bacterium]
MDGPTEVSVPADAAVPAAQDEDEPAPVSGPPRKRTLTGNVVSDKGDRTIVVSIARRKKHRLYKKYITLTKKLKAHDPDNECQVGDLVRVVESRPLSREKRWRLVEIVKRAG